MLTYSVEWIRRDDEADQVAYFGSDLRAAQAKARRASDKNDCVAYVVATRETYRNGRLESAESVGEISYWGGLESGRDGLINEAAAA